MTEAIFGIIGVILGSGISWFQSYWVNKNERNKNARYLAIRVVCILDKYLEDCTEVVKDNGLSYGQRSAEGHLVPQVQVPNPPVYPEDADWKSIDHELMYRILSFPAEIESGNRMIKSTSEIASAPDFEEWFYERKFYYSQFGLAAYKLADDLSLKYGIKKIKYNDWDPVADLTKEFDEVVIKRNQKMQENIALVKRILG